MKKVKSLFSQCIFILLVVSAFGFLLERSYAGSMVWEDDNKLLQDYLSRIAKLKEESKYVPFSGQSVLVNFFSGQLEGFYVYPEGKAKLLAKDGKEGLKGKKYLDLLLPDNEYAGTGILLSAPIDLSDLSLNTSPYLHFFIKLKTTDLNNVKIALVQTKEPRFESALDLANYVKVKKTEWQEIKIPIDDFPKIGSCWDMKNQKMFNGKVQFNEIVELKIFIAEPKTKILNLLISEINIMGFAINKATYVPIYKESISDLAYSYSYPQDSKLKETSSEKYSGDKSLELDFNPKESSGIALGTKTINVLKNRENLVLEFWVKGNKGDEKLSVGFSDSEDDKIKCRTLLPLISYVLISKEWQKVEIPLSNFQGTGKFWDGKQELDKPFQFDKIQELVFTINANDNTECTIYVDDIRIKYKDISNSVN